ncbi:tRNA modification GTPase trmE [Caloramator fervidus]|uniref:tRNA modification GTPase MnmE n=1 Tax=Caloramator fervidus TaxID=29344 RepID=A0A1H5WFX4_9CLOT|nr:tRNA uridine-5-carboxymethylaminomethyl(34) synthesis GTPase MnmE [Caloramator fervidus]SEF98176.1 tRNA modification GTPase trmE [Caloramator fervidus]
MLNDTIAAISTAIGEGGIGIVRLSGDKSLEIASKIFKSAKGKDVKNMKSYTMLYGYVIDPDTDEIVDEVILSYMKAPYTYTREDIVEINCHGGVLAVRKVLSLVLKNGARLAEPGEFTKRAFLNGRIDLSQAEAVIDLIRAKTDDSLNLAVNQLKGKLSEKIKHLMDKLLGSLAHIEATVDFPEDEVDELVVNKLLDDLNYVYNEIDYLIKNAESGKIFRDGLKTTIVGKPNVGKSSLLNAFLQEKRAIVTDIPGTTRDVIEEYINIDGIPVILVDTAGIRETEDIVENIGVEKSKEYIQNADLIIFMMDGSRPLEKEDEDIMDLIEGKNVIAVVNKIDLPIKIDMDYINKRFKNVVKASVKDEHGVEEIKKAIADLVFKGKVSSKNDILVTNVRHKDALIKANESILKGIQTIKSNLPLDLASIELKEAYLKLGEITGNTVAEDIIDRIFCDFCIGK